MADSSFDPNALVKAMGPQRDPFSWAEMYYQDAAKSNQLREEIKNRLLLHQSDQAARSKEHGLTLAQQRELHKDSQAGMDRRQNQAIKAGRYGGSSGGGVVILPSGSIEGKEMQTDIRKKYDRSQYEQVQIGGHAWHVPKGQTGAIRVVKGAGLGSPPTTGQVAAPATAPDPDIEDFDLP